MAAPLVDVGSNLQAQIQSLVQPKLVENSWVDDENDTTLSEYVTMMIVNGKDLKGVQSELGGDLLGVGEDDPAVGAFAQWLFDTVRQLSAPQQQEEQPQEQQPQPIPTVQDAQMEDTSASTDAPYVNFSHLNNYNGHGPQAGPMYPHPYHHGYMYGPQMMPNPYAYQQMQRNSQLTQNQYSPTGPRSMRNGSTQGRGRGGRMLGQMNRSMDRTSDLPDNLRRIKGASGIASGRINSHSTRDGPPRGPRGSSIANGVQRMMNGGRGGHQNNMGAMPNPMMGGPANPQQQMQFMQMMEMQTNMMAQLIANGQVPNMNGNFQHNQRGGRGGQRGGARGGHKQLHAVNGKMPDGALPGSNTNTGGSGMDIDGDEANHGDKFSTLCRFNLSCTNPSCGFAHQSPAAPPNAPVDMSDTCTHGAACTNHKCSGRHPSPAQRNGGGGAQNTKQEVDCKFYPNCTAGPKCPFRHPTEKPCKFGGDCTNPSCKFAHPKIMCRYNPCLNPSCMFKHADGQKRGKFEDKVWTSEEGKADRFAEFAKQTENGEEELVLPGQNDGQQQQQNGNGNGGGDAMESQQSENANSQQMETQIVV